MKGGVRILKRLLTVVLATFVALALVEGVLQLFSADHEGYYIWPPGVRTTFRPLPEALPGIEGDSRFSTNALGLRGEELDDARTPVVVALGGSATECLYLDQDETWPHLLQQRLREGGAPNAWVANGGRSGHGTREHVYQVPRILAGVPRCDFVLILVGVNDLGLRLQQDEDYDPNYLERPGADAKMLRRAFAVYPDEEVPLLKRTQLFKRLRALKHAMGGAAQDEAGRQYVRWREARRNATAMRDTLPDMGTALAEYERNLGRILDAFEGGRAKPILVTQPVIWDAKLPPEVEATLWWIGVGDFLEPGTRTEYYTAAALAEGMKLYNDALRRVARRRGVHLIDLAARLPRDPALFYDDMHFTEKGARQVAGILADGFPR